MSRGILSIGWNSSWLGLRWCHFNLNLRLLVLCFANPTKYRSCHILRLDSASLLSFFFLCLEIIFVLFDITLLIVKGALNQFSLREGFDSRFEFLLSRCLWLRVRR